MRMKLLVAFTCLLFIFAGSCSAAPEDSSSDQAAAVAAAIKQANLHLANNNPEAAIAAAKKAAQEAQGSGLKQLKIDALYIASRAYLVLGKINEGTSLLEEIRADARAIGYARGEGDAENGLGSIYFEQGHYAPAMKSFIRALDIRTAMEDSVSISKTLNNMGRIHERLGNYDKAIDLYHQSLQLKGERDLTGQVNTLNNLGISYLAKGDHEAALDCFRTALGLAEDLDYLFGQSFSLNNLANAYTAIGDLYQAEQAALRAVAIAKKTNYPLSFAYTLTGAGKMYLAKGQPELSLQYLQQASVIAAEQNNLSLQRDIDKIETQAYKELGNYYQALRSLEQYWDLQQKILNSDTAQIIAISQAEYEVKQKELEIGFLRTASEAKNAEIRAQDRLMTVLIVFLIFNIMTSIYLRRQISLRMAKEAALAESERNYRILIEQSADGIITIDAATNDIVTVNQRFSEMVGFSKEQLIPHGRKLYLPPDDYTDWALQLSKLRQTGRDYLGIKNYIRSDGTYLEVERNAAIITYDGKESVLINIRDVSEKRRLEQILIQDVNLAGELQHALLPADLENNFCQVRSVFSPQHIVSGDHLNFIAPANGNKLNGYLIDVTGHGIATALETAAIRVIVEEYINPVGNLSHEVICQINKRLSHILSEGNFVAFLGFSFDFDEWKLTVGTYGINILLASSGSWQGLTCLPGSYLGITNNLEDSMTTISIKPGDKFYFTTDGITDIIDETKLPSLADFVETHRFFSKLAHSENRRDDCSGIFVNLINNDQLS